MTNNIFLKSFSLPLFGCFLFATCKAADLEVFDLGKTERYLGQSIITSFNGTLPNDSGVDQICSHLKEGHIGGVVLYEKNITGSEQLLELINKIQQANPNAIIALDQESGLVRRLRERNGFKEEMGFPFVPSALKVAELSYEEASNLYIRLAEKLKHYGFNTNFAPVVDLHDAESKAIGRLERSFSDDPDVVTKFATTFIEAHHQHHLLTALKHFPGHGLARDDTHHNNVDVTKVANLGLELKPYYTLIDEGKVDMIMTAHVVNTNLDAEGHPATLSSKIIPSLLRDKGYDGVVVSDDLSMKAISNYYDSTFNAAHLAYAKATCDMLVITAHNRSDTDIGKLATEYLAKKAQTGEISRERIEESYRRIQNLKQRFN